MAYLGGTFQIGKYELFFISDAWYVQIDISMILARLSIF